MADSKSEHKDGDLERNVDEHLEVDHVEPQQQKPVNGAADANGRMYSTGGRPYSTSGRRLSEWDAMKIAKQGGAEIDEEIAELDAELMANPIKNSWMNPEIKFADPRHFTWLLVAFASMGGLLSGIDQSLISGANLYMPASLHLDTSQVSLVSSGVPLGAIGGALLLGPTNEAIGRKNAIIFSLILYTIGAALEAGAISFGMMVAGRVIL